MRTMLDEIEATILRFAEASGHPVSDLGNAGRDKLVEDAFRIWSAAGMTPDSDARRRLKVATVAFEAIRELERLAPLPGQSPEDFNRASSILKAQIAAARWDLHLRPERRGVPNWDARYVALACAHAWHRWIDGAWIWNEPDLSESRNRWLVSMGCPPGAGRLPICGDTHSLHAQRDPHSEGNWAGNGFPSFVSEITKLLPSEPDWERACKWAVDNYRSAYDPFHMSENISR